MAIFLRHYLIVCLGLLFTFAACTPPSPPPSPTPWPTVTTASPAPTRGSAQTARPVLTTPTATRTPQPHPTSTPTPSAARLVVWASLPEAQAQALADDIEAFQDEFPQYLVSLEHYEQPEQFLASLAAGEINFDVVLASPILLASLKAQKQIGPMSDFFPPSFSDSFAATTVAGAVRDGEWWGVPDTAGFHLLLFYNRDLVDRPPANTEELFDLARTLTRRQPGSQTSRWGLGVNSYDPLWLVPWLSAYDGWLTNETGQPTLNTPAMVGALGLYLAWQNRSTGIAPIETYETVRTLFLRGDVAMMIDGEWAIAELARAGELNWGVSPLPNVGQAEENRPAAPLVLARYWAVSHSTGGSRALAATAFLDFITRPERQLAWTSRFGLLPTRRRALDDPLIVSNSALRASALQMRAGRVVPLGTNANAILNAMRQPLQAAIDGDLTIQEAVKLMQANVER